MGQTSPRREKAPSQPPPRPGMWYLSSWRDLRRRSNAGHGLWNKPEITPPSHSNHRPAGTLTLYLGLCGSVVGRGKAEGKYDLLPLCQSNISFVTNCLGAVARQS